MSVNTTPVMSIMGNSHRLSRMYDSANTNIAHNAWCMEHPARINL